MIIEAGCIGRDREVGEILERAAQLTQTSYLLVTGAAGIGKSTLLRHVAQLAPQQDLSIRTIDDADNLDATELTEVIGENDDAHLVLLTATHETPALMSFLPDVMPLAGLDRDAVAALATARARVVHPTVVDTLTHHTGGNPRDILSLLDELPGRAWSARTPD